MNYAKYLRWTFAVLPLLAVIGCGSADGTQDGTAHVQASDGTLKPKDCAPWENCGDDPEPGPAPSGPCTVRPQHCCEEDFDTKQCTLWVSACMACP